jgi:hypothetical protein
MERRPAMRDRGDVTPVLVVITSLFAVAAIAAAAYGGWFVLTH